MRTLDGSRFFRIPTPPILILRFPDGAVEYRSTRGEVPIGTLVRSRGSLWRVRQHTESGAAIRQSNLGSKYSSPIEEAKFQTLLDQVRDLHRLTDELARSRTRIHENVRARLTWNGEPPALPPEQRKLADDAVDALESRWLSSSQSRQLHRAFFGK